MIGRTKPKRYKRHYSVLVTHSEFKMRGLLTPGHREQAWGLHWRRRGQGQVPCRAGRSCTVKGSSEGIRSLVSRRSQAIGHA